MTILKLHIRQLVCNGRIERELRGEYFGYSADNHRGIVSDFEDAREKFLILKKKIVTKSPKMAKTAIFQACLFIQNSDLGKSFVHHRGQVLNFCQNIHPCISANSEFYGV